MKKTNLLIAFGLVFSLCACKTTVNNNTIITTNDDGDKIVKKELAFENESTFYPSENSKITTYYFNNSSIPYVSIDDFYNNIGPYENSFTANKNGNNYEYKLIKNNEELKIGVNSETDCITMYNYGFMSVDEMEYEKVQAYSKNLRMSIVNTNDPIADNIDLSKYGLDIKEVDSKAVIPFHVVTSLFTIDSYYSVIYLGNKYIGSSYDDEYDLYSYNANITFTDEYMEYTYNMLDFIYNELYGLTGYFGFDMSEKLREFKTDILNKNTHTEAVQDFLLSLNDCHTWMETNDFKVPSNSRINSYYNDRYREMVSIYRALRDMEPIDNMSFIDNKTGYFRFNSFVVDEENGPNVVFYNFLTTCKENNIEDIVIDVTRNGGGDTFSLAQIVGLMTNDDAIIESTNIKNKQVTKEVFKVDADFDGDFSDDDAFDEFNYYVLTSGYTFSCANEFANYCKKYNIATVIGNKSGGGACSIYPQTLPTGFSMITSSINALFDDKGELTELGVEPDIEIPFENIYNKNSILDAISNSKK